MVTVAQTKILNITPPRDMNAKIWDGPDSKHNARGVAHLRILLAEFPGHPSNPSKLAFTAPSQNLHEVRITDCPKTVNPHAREGAK